MSPPIVYELTRPNSQRTIRMTAIVQSISCLLWLRQGDHSQNLRDPEYGANVVAEPAMRHELVDAMRGKR
jgi:hypothetical protein